MVFDEGSLIAVTESSIEVKSLIHLSQNPETTSVKTVVNRISSRQRIIPLTRNEDFLW
jgi:tetrahydromethanopterin S-methyltransferase subunit F